MAHRKKNELSDVIQEVSVIDLILMDHRFLKQCMEILKSDKIEEKKKLHTAKEFLDALQTHSNAEKKSIYKPLESNEELHFNILEAEVEHGIIDQKVKTLKLKMTHLRKMSDELEAEIKVLCELLNNHLKEEESEILPKMQSELDDRTLDELGASFMRLRKFSSHELGDYPLLEDELIQWKDSVQKLSSQFLRKMDKVVENLRH